MPQDFRLIVHSARLGAGLSVYALAKSSGVPQQTLHNWLSGKNRTINSESLARVCAVLGLSLKFTRPPAD